MATAEVEAQPSESTALASAREPSRSKTELYSCLAFLRAIATLTAVVTTWRWLPVRRSPLPTSPEPARSWGRSVRDRRSAFFSEAFLLIGKRLGGCASTGRDRFRSAGASSRSRRMVRERLIDLPAPSE
jgi:hypothetical protein